MEDGESRHGFAAESSLDFFDDDAACYSPQSSSIWGASLRISRPLSNPSTTSMVRHSGQGKISVSSTFGGGEKMAAQTGQSPRRAVSNRSIDMFDSLRHSCHGFVTEHDYKIKFSSVKFLQIIYNFK
jgi:hypothetical protein